MMDKIEKFKLIITKNIKPLHSVIDSLTNEQKEYYYSFISRNYNQEEELTLLESKFHPNLQLPKQFRRLKKMNRKPKYIILHDTNCLSHRDESLSVINSRNTLGPIKINQILIEKRKEINYHFIVDKIGKDFEIISARPLQYICEFPEIRSDIGKQALHVLIASDLSINVPDKRFYDVLAYKLLAPMINVLQMPKNPKSTIIGHKDVLNKTIWDRIKEIFIKRPEQFRNLEQCPGSFLFFPLLHSTVQKYM